MVAGPAEDPLEALARQARVDQAAESRRRRAHWEQLGAEEASLPTVLERLARDGAAVRLHWAGGTEHGSVTEVGPDHVRLAAGGRWCALRYRAVEWVEPTGTHEGPPPARVDLGFDDRLRRHAGEGVVLVLASGTTLAGRLEAVGVDVLTVVPDGGTEALYSSSSAVLVLRAGEGSG